jgi:glycosyltransferase involved in cell wall biosynthesis
MAINILVVADSLDPLVGGAEISTRDMMWLYADHGLNVNFVTGIGRDIEKKNSIKIYEKEFYGYYFQKSSSKILRNYRSILNFKALIAIFRSINTYKPDVIILNNISDQISYASILLVRLLNLPVIQVLRDSMALTSGKFTYNNNNENIFRVSYFKEARRASLAFNPIKSIWAKYCINHASVVVSISHELSRFFEYNGVRIDCVIHNGVLIINNRSCIESTAEKEQKIIFWPARFSVLKGALAVLEMFSSIKDESIKLIITADKKDIKDERLLTYIASKNNIIFTGWLPKTKIDELYCKATVVVYPSLYLEPFGRVPVEAMAFKKPVIVSKYGGLKEIVLHEYNGFVIDPEDKNEFLDAINKIFSDRTYSSKLGSNGYNRYKECFSGEVMINKYLTLIDNIVEDHE